MMYISFIDEGVYLEGTFTVNGNNITVDFGEADLVMTGTIRGDRITLDLDGVDVVYEKNDSFTFDPSRVPDVSRAPWDDPNLLLLPYGEHRFTEETYFRFVPNQYGTWEFSTSGSGDSDPVITIYDDNGNQIAYDDDGGDGYEAYLLLDLTGPVIVRVHFWGTPTTTYLSIELVGGLEGEVIPGVGGTVRVTGETDFIFIPSRSAVWEIITFDNGSYDPTLELYDSRGNMIEEDDDSGDGRNALIAMYLEEGETYRITAGFWGSSGGSSTYTLSVTLAPEIPSNGGTVVANGATGFSFTPGQSGSWVFETTNNGASDPRLFIYDSSGALIADDDDSGDGRNAFITINLDAGRTYSIAAAFWGSSEGSYDLNVTRG